MTTYDEHLPHFGHSKRHKVDIMDEYLASIGYQRKPIPKDGSCLFRALSEQLFSTQAHHLFVRGSCCRYMKRNQETFENFIDGSFDEYLTKMNNPKEWGDQLEISALSKMYCCDFCIYEQPGQRAKNVTENDFKRKIYLCHSGQKHYDSVYPLPYFNNYGICQSIIYSLLFEKILGFDERDFQKAIATYRMLSTSSCDDDEETVFPPDFLYEPSIGILTPGVPPQHQHGLAYKFPISIDFIRGLDPSLHRNIDYDFWITIKRAQQYIDFSIAETMPYLIGDRCMVTLSIYSKPLVGHVQEVSPDFGPITVFIEDLGGKHTIAVKNAKPMCSYNNGCRLDLGRYKRKPYQDSNGWGWKGKRCGSYRSKQFGMTPVHLSDLNFNPKYLEFVASQQKKLRSSVAAAISERDGRNGNNSNHKNKGKNNRKKASLDPAIPAQNQNEAEYLGNHDNSEWEVARHAGYAPHEGGQVLQPRTDESIISQMWELNINAEETTMMDNVGCEANNQTTHNNNCDLNSLNGVNNCYASQDSQDSISSDTTVHQNTIKEPEDENNNQETTSPPITMQPEQNNNQQNGGYDAYGQPINYGPSSYPPNPPPQYYPQQSFPNPGYNPYAMTEGEGKEAEEEKSTFQYFYNLGLEYYRQLSANGQRPVLVNGPHYVQPNNNATMGFVPNNQHYINNQQCVPHFHPVSPTDQFNNQRLLVQVPPPPTTPIVQQFQHPQYTTPPIEGNSPEAPVDMVTNRNVTPPSHVYMLQPDLPNSPMYQRPCTNAPHRGPYVPRVQHYPNVYQQPRFDGSRVQGYPQVVPHQHHQHHFRASIG